MAQSWSRRHLACETLRVECTEQLGAESTADVYRDGYARPLLLVLAGVVETGDQRWAAVYNDERRRFLWGPTHRSELSALVHADIAELVALVGNGAAKESLESLLVQIHRPLTESAPSNGVVRVGLIGDCLMTEMRAFLTQATETDGIDVQVSHEYFSASGGVAPTFEQTLGKVQRGELDLVGMSFLTFEGLPLYKALLAESGWRDKARMRLNLATIVQTVSLGLESLRSVSDVPVLLHTACGLPLDRVRRRLPWLPAQSRRRRALLADLNAQLTELARANENVMILDESALLGEGGLRAGSAPLFPHTITDGAVFHTSSFGALVADEYAALAADWSKLKKTKVLCIDFDNTLWSGVMAEGPVVHDLDAQRLLSRLREAGILLVAVTKNDPGSIRWNEMALTPDDFVLHKVSWNQKAQSIREAADQLDLGIDSFVLIDDNPVERALVSEQIPQVTVLDPLEPGTWRAVARLLDFPNTTQTAEAKLRTEKYRETAARREAMVAELDYPAMMASLDLVVHWGPLREDQVDRARELISRTNQFNTTTRRLSMHEIRELMAAPDREIFAYELSDRFGALGLVGLVTLRRDDQLTTVDAVVMSCRAMGFGLEQFMVLAPLVERPAVRTVGEFIPSERNGPSSGVFAACGFESTPTGEWVLDKDADRVQLPAWLRVIRWD